MHFVPKGQTCSHVLPISFYKNEIKLNVGNAGHA